MKTFIALILAFIMLSSFATAAITKMNKAHKGVDRFSNPALWEGLFTTDITREERNGHKCLGDEYCNAPRRCSRWGWCQDTSYGGPFFP